VAPGPGGHAGAEHPLSEGAGDAADPAAQIDEAVAALRRGGLVAFPTETVYGLGADAERPEAVAAVFAAKGRPGWHPLIVHGADASVLERYCEAVPPGAPPRPPRLWPGPLTLVLRRSDRVPDEVTGGRDTVAVRVPDQPLALELLRRFGRGVAAPSANRFGHVSPTSAADVRTELGDAVDVVLDGGRCAVGVESTILDLSGERPALLRRGAIGAARLAEELGARVAEDAGPARAPGMLEAHYQPDAVVELTDPARLQRRARELVERGRAVAVLGAPAGTALPGAVRRLASPSDPEEYAHELYAQLRAADAAGAEVVLAVPPPPEGIGAAVLDRLRRAAATAVPE
jgi:L-threonylcarbamoyladenylate synthase